MIKSESFKLFLIILAVIGLLSFMHSAAQAAVTGKIAGTIVDSQTKEPLPGVNVMVEGTTLGAASMGDGTYFVIGVPPGIYTVTASIIGYQKMSLSDVRVMVDRTTTADFSLKSTAIESKEAVMVTAERPVILKDLTATATQTGADVVEVTPLESVRDLINLNAGILRDLGGNIIIRGGEANQLKFYVDGVSMEKLDTFEGGLAFSSQTTKTSIYQFNILGVQEMEVVTGGFNAEYGDAQSGVVNVVTKEGAGAYHGEFRMEYSPPGQYHFGPYIYDHNVQAVYRQWGDFSQWEAWNNAKPNPKLLKDSIPIWFERFKKIVNPSKDHLGGIYDYRKETYKRAIWGVGGPIIGNKMTFFFSGELRQKPSLITTAVKFFNYYNLDFNATYRFSPKMKLRGKVYAMHDRSWYRANEDNIFETYAGSTRGTGAWARRDGYPEKYSFGEAITWTHTLSPTTFYEVLISHVRDQRQYGGLGEGFPNSRAWWIPPGPYFLGFNVPTSNFSQNIGDSDTHNYRYKVDFVSQLNSHNQLKAGAEGRLYNGYSITGGTAGVLQFADASWRASAYYLTPRYFAGYLQDKMEYGGMIANLGVRMDVYDSHIGVSADKYDPVYVLDNIVRGNPAKVPNKKLTRISPRIGFSHPVSENTAFHFQYGHFYQVPEPQMMNDYGTYGGGFSAYPNPNLEPGKTVSYEFGIQHSLRSVYRINAVVYFNDLSNQARQKNLYMPRVGDSTRRFFTRYYDNFGYGTAKGFEITLDRTAVGKWYYRITYSLARVFVGSTGTNEQWSDDPNDERNWVSRQSSRTTLRSSDRTHRITGIVSFRSPREWGKALGDWDIGLTTLVQTGLPFTYTMSYEESLNLVNNRRWPIQQNTDLSVKKWITLGRLRPHVYLRITNLVNNRYIRPETSGSVPKDWIQFNSTWEDESNANWVLSNYQWYINETRRFYFGIGFNF